MYQSLDQLIQKIGFDTGLYPYVGLLSATPQNNRPNDLKNQIYLFERNHNDSTLKKAESGNIERFFADVNREYEQLIDRKNDIPAEERDQRLDAISKRLRDCVLSDILERRTRTDVEKYYKEDMEAQGLVFPKIVGPNNLEYIMDDELAQLFSDTMKIIAPTNEEKLQTDEWLRYFRYRAIEYFTDPANERKHTGRGNRSVSDVSKQLATIMQILLVKRLKRKPYNKCSYPTAGKYQHRYRIIVLQRILHSFVYRTQYRTYEHRESKQPYILYPEYYCIRRPKQPIVYKLRNTRPKRSRHQGK